MQEQTREGFMCLTDFRHELGEASGGAKIYPTVEDLKHHMGCTDECGIACVRITLVNAAHEGVLHA